MAEGVNKSAGSVSAGDESEGSLSSDDEADVQQDGFPSDDGEALFRDRDADSRIMQIVQIEIENPGGEDMHGVLGQLRTDHSLSRSGTAVDWVVRRAATAAVARAKA